MAIELNVDRLNAGSASTLGDVATGAGEVAGKALTALLGGDSVKVTSGAVTDLEALVARLKSESERAKFSLLLTSLNAIGQSLTETQKRQVEQGVKLQEKLEQLNQTVEENSAKLTQAKADVVILEAKIKSLKQQIEQAVKDGKEHNELVAEMKRARSEYDAKQKVIADTTDKINDAKNEISSVQGQISALVKTIGENAVKTIAVELAKLAEPEQAERPAEAKKAEEKELENDPLAVIRESLDRIGRDIAATIEEQRIETV